jgi:hypothetical protein
LATAEQIAFQLMKLAQPEQTLIAHDEHPQKDHQSYRADDVHGPDEIVYTLEPCGDALFHIGN